LYQDQGNYGRDMSPSSRIYNLVRGLAESGQCRPEDADEDEDEAGGMELSMRKVEERVIAKGFTRDQWQTAVMEYTNLDVSLPLSVPSHPKNFTDVLSTDLANSRQRHTPHFHRLGSCRSCQRCRVRHGIIESLVKFLRAWIFIWRSGSCGLSRLGLSATFPRQKRALSCGGCEYRFYVRVEEDEFRCW
jgi:hypothetical protein